MSLIILLLAILIFGLFVGSFLNVAIMRLPKEETIIRGRSRCDSCGRTLFWYELIPLFSFIIQRGKCRTCRAKISLQHPIVEVATALIFAGSLLYALSGDLNFGAVNAGSLALFFPVLIVFTTLFFIFMFDLRTRLIPDLALVLIVFTITIAEFLGAWHIAPLFTFGFGKFGANLFNSIFAGTVLSLPFFAIVLFSRGRLMGMGDAKFAFTIGFILGLLKGFLAIFSASILGAIIGLSLIVLKKKSMKSAVPFAPFLVLGILLALLFGEPILRWYGKFFLF